VLQFKSAASVLAHDDSIWSVAWSKNNQHEYILTGSVDSLVKSWYWDGKEAFECRHKLEGHNLGVLSVGIDKTGTVGVSSSLDSHIKIWNLESGKLIQDIDAGPVNAFTVAINPHTGTTIAAGSNTGEVNVYDTEQDGKRVVKLTPRDRQFAMSVGYSTDGTKLACGSIGGVVTIFDLTTGANGSIAHSLTEAHTMPVRSLCFSPDQKSNLLFTACDDGTIKIFDTREAGHVGTITGHASWVLSVACSPDGTQLASGSSDKTVKIWDLRQRECRYTADGPDGHNGQVWSVAYNRTGERVASVSDDKKLLITECPP
jgi:WD repeat-containing protein 61